MNKQFQAKSNTQRNLCRLGNVATYINGYAFAPSDWDTKGLPIIRIQDLTGNSYQANYFSGKIDDRFKIHSGDILISWSASLGIFEWQRGDAVLNQHIFKVVFDKIDIEKDFFVHQLRMLLERFASEAHGATMKHLTRPVFNALPFHAPSLDEQKRISSILGSVCSMISICQRQLCKLDQMVKSRFIELFGDPVKNPRKWNFKTLLELGHCKNGLNFHNGETGFRINCLGVGDFQNHSVIDRTDNLPFITVAEYPPKDYLLQDGDIVFVRSNGNKALVGRCLIVYPHDNPTI